MILTFVTPSGSPGATTTALGLALNWPRPVLLIENSIGSPVLAGYGRGEIAHDRGLLSLLAGHRDGVISSAIDLATTQLPGTNVQLIAGFTNADQVGSATDALWSALRGPLLDISTGDMDVIIDAGRFGMRAFPLPILTFSDRVFLVSRTSLTSIAGALCVVPTLKRELRDLNVDTLQALIVGERQPYAAKSACDLLELPLGGGIAWDPRNARVFSDGEQPTRKFHISDLQRSITKLTGTLQDFATTSGATYA